MSGLVAGLD